MFIYLVHNTVNGKYYVGQTTKTLEQRWQWHVRDAKKGRSPHLYNAIRKYGPEAFRIHALMSTLKTKAQLDEQEEFLIALFRASDPEHGYNLTSGGDSPSPTSEGRKKMSAACLGKPKSAEWRKQMSESKKLWWANQTKELRDANARRAQKAQTGSHPFTGRQHSTETRRKISETKFLKTVAWG